MPGENSIPLKDHLSIPAKIICLIAVFSFNCHNKSDGIPDPLEKNLRLSGSNRREMEKVMDYFKRDPDSLKLKAAVVLLSNMEDKFHYEGPWLNQMVTLFFDRSNHRTEEELQRLRDSVYHVIGHPDRGDFRKIEDLKSLSADYIIQNIESAYHAWQHAPWRPAVSFNAFCNYILPYKTYIQSPEAWRTALADRYAYILNHPAIPQAMEDICCAMVDEQKKWLSFSEEPLGYPGSLNISLIHKLKKGNCVELSAYGAQSARALGIPVALDYVPQYGNRFTTH